MKTFLGASLASRNNFFPAEIKPSRATPSGLMIVLGETSLSGISSGSIALEFLCGCSEKNSSTRIWTLQERLGQLWEKNGTANLTESQYIDAEYAYSRLCADPPKDVPQSPPMTYWINPEDKFTQYAGLGSQWLEILDGQKNAGLVLAKLNTLMLGLDSIQKLQANGLMVKLTHH